MDSAPAATLWGEIGAAWGGAALVAFLILSFTIPPVSLWRVHAPMFMAQIQKLILADSLDRANKLCNAAPSGLLPRVIKAGLTRADRSVNEIQNAMDEEAVAGFSKLRLHKQAGITAGLVTALWMGGTAYLGTTWPLVAGAVGVLLIWRGTVTCNRLEADLNVFPVKLIDLLAARQDGVLREDARPSPAPARPAAPAEGGSNIFLCTRREDSEWATDRIYRTLVGAFGRDHVFQGQDSIPPGVAFPEHIDAQIARCDWFVAVIGGSWMDRARLDDPRDPVRVELETAFRRQIAVVLLLVGDAEPPSAEELPEGMKRLPDMNGLQVRSAGSLERDIAPLIQVIREGPRTA